MDEIDYNELSKIVCNNIENVIKSIVQTNLENCISSNLSERNRKDENLMSAKYRERVRIGTDSENNPIFAWACGNSKDELHRSIAQLLSMSSVNKDECDAQDTANNSSSNAIKWESCVDRWFDLYHKSKVGAKALIKDTSLIKNHVRPAFLDKPIAKIKVDDVQSYLETKSAYSKAQLRDVMSLMSGVFSYAVDSDFITKNPMKSKLIHNPSTKAEAVRKALSSNERADIILHLNDLRNVYDKNGDNMNALRFMAFLIYTCMRPCEILGLMWEDIDLDRCTINIKRDVVYIHGKAVVGKTKTEESKREIPFDKALLEYLLPAGESGFVIRMSGKDKNNQPLSEIAKRHMWDRITKTIDVHGMTPYSGRHTYASEMNRAGVPIKTAMVMMGHKDERMLLRRYTHVDEEDLKAANNVMSAYTLTIQSQAAGL